MLIAATFACHAAFGGAAFGRMHDGATIRRHDESG
jgi:hypothetical protein